MTDTMKMPDISNPDTTASWQKIDPWGAAPHIASKLRGLGGHEPSPDPGFVFATAFFTVAPGRFRMRIVVEEGYPRSDAAFLLEISNRSDFPGSPPVRMRLELAPLRALGDAEGHFDLTIAAEPNTQYALAGFFHGDDDLHITELRVFADCPIQLAMDPNTDPISVIDGSEKPLNTGLQTRDVSRLTGSEQPSFTNPYSQPWTSIQQSEPAFRMRCAELGLNSNTAAPWPEAFILQTLLKYGALAPDRYGIGFDCGEQALPWSLLTYGARVLMTRFDEYGAEASLGAELKALKRKVSVAPEVADALAYTTLVPRGLPKGYYGAFDFAWWITPNDISASDIVNQFSAIISALRSGGIAVLVLPFQPGKIFGLKHEDGSPTITRPTIERIALEVIAQGHSVAQLRFGSPLSVPSTARFGIIVARS